MEHQTRQYTDNEIYEHFNNCQDYLTYDADETTVWRRRIAFRKSINFLKELVEEGVAAAQPTFIESTFGSARSYGDATEAVKKVRKIGVDLARAFTDRFGLEKAVALMLSTVMETLHKSILIVSLIVDIYHGI